VTNRLHMTLAGITLVLLTLSTLASADSRVDLTEYLTPQPLAGDFKAFEFSDQAGRVIAVLSVTPWKSNGWQTVVSQEDEGVEPRLSRSSSFPERSS